MSIRCLALELIMWPIFAHLIIGGVPVAAAIAGVWLGRRSRMGGWLLFVIVSILWASIIVPFPDGNPIGTSEEWHRRLKQVSALPVGVLVGVAIKVLASRKPS